MTACPKITDRFVYETERTTEPSIVGRSKKLWALSDEIYFVRLVESLSSFTFDRNEVVEGTGPARLDFYELAASKLHDAGIPCAFVRRVDSTGYLVRYYESPPVEVIVKNRAIGSTIRKYPGLFVEDTPLPRPVVKFDYRCDPEDQPIGEDYLRALNLPVDKMRLTALAVNDVLVEWLAPLQVWDFCLIYGLDRDGVPHIISEVSPECMRLRDEKGKSLDKDLFRDGCSHVEITTTWRDLIEKVR